MKKDIDIKVFQVKVKFEDGTEYIEQFDIEHYIKVVSIYVTPIITSSSLILNGKRVKSVSYINRPLKKWSHVL